MIAFELILFAGLIALLIYAFVRASKSRRGQKREFEKLLQSGFKVDHLLSTKRSSVGVAFNDKDRNVAFIYPDGVRQYDYTDIRQWNWQWVDKNGIKTNNALHFHLNDKERPLIKIQNLSTSYAEEWHSKLGAILSA